MEQREIIAQNLQKYRKANKLTQLELAQSLNYSDKAISKWESGEAFPDIFTFMALAKMYEISVNDLIYPPRSLTRRILWRSNERILVPIVVALGITFITTLVYYILESVGVKWDNWIVYFYSLPVIFLVLMIFNFIWGRRYLAILLVSALGWSILLAIYLTANLDPSLFYLGIPMQCIIALSFLIRPNPARKVK